jgi:hypothetical protein
MLPGEIEVFDRAHCDTILINAAGCGSTLKEYEHLLENDPDLMPKTSAFVGKVKDFSEWMDHVGWSCIRTGLHLKTQAIFHQMELEIQQVSFKLPQPFMMLVTWLMLRGLLNNRVI